MTYLIHYNEIIELDDYDLHCRTARKKYYTRIDALKALLKILQEDMLRISKEIEDEASSPAV